MVRKRQNKQLELTFAEQGTSEACDLSSKGSIRAVAAAGTERPTSDDQLMEEICAAENLRKALKRVRGNKGSPGIDGMTVDELPDYLKRHWPERRQALLAGQYKPKAVKRVEIDKPEGGVRKLGIPTALDRFIQQAVMQVLQEQWDPTFSEHSYGFRPGRSAHEAVAQAQKYVAAGYRYVVDFDLEKFFDRVHHDRLLARIAQRVSDKRVLKLIRAFLTAGVMENGLVSRTTEGTPQGGPISPLLSNLVLDELDRELERRGHRFCRYADDCNVYVRSERAGQRVMSSVCQFITRKLKLKVNESKSAVAKVEQRQFLGFSIISAPDGRPLRSISAKAVRRFRKRVRAITGRRRGKSLQFVIEELASYLRGWRQYFRFCETPRVLQALDKWIRRRLRSLVWKLWKTRKRRKRGLLQHGVREPLATNTASSDRGPWHTAASPALSFAFPNAFFDAHGLPSVTVS